MSSININALKAAVNQIQKKIPVVIKLLLLLLFIAGIYLKITTILVLIFITSILFYFLVRHQYLDNINKESYLTDGTHAIYIKNKGREKKIILSIKNGKRDGFYTQYYVYNGQIEFQKEYSNGELNGSYKEFYQNGQIKFQKEYSNGELNGSYKEFYQNGQIKFDSIWNNGKQNGPQLAYSFDGLLIRKSNFNNDEYVGFEEYFKNGCLRLQNLNGNYIFFSENNQKKCEIVVDINSCIPKGIWVNYDENEIVNYKLNFDYENYENQKKGKVIKTTYDKLGNQLTSSFETFKVKYKYNYYIKHNYFWERFYSKLKLETGVKGPPGVGFIEIDLSPVTCINDLIAFENDIFVDDTKVMELWPYADDVEIGLVDETLKLKYYDDLDDTISSYFDSNNDF